MYAEHFIINHHSTVHPPSLSTIRIYIMHHTRTHIPYSVSLTFCLSLLARLDIASTKIAKKKIRLALPHTHVFVYMGVNAACKPWPIETKMGNGTENWPTVSSLFGQHYVKIIPGKRDNQLSGCKGFSSTSTSFSRLCSSSSRVYLLWPYASA